MSTRLLAVSQSLLFFFAPRSSLATLLIAHALGFCSPSQLSQKGLLGVYTSLTVNPQKIKDQNQKKRIRLLARHNIIVIMGIVCLFQVWGGSIYLINCSREPWQSTLACVAGTKWGGKRAVTPIEGEKKKEATFCPTSCLALPSSPLSFPFKSLWHRLGELKLLVT